MVVHLKVLIHSVDYDDPGTCQNIIWRKLFLEFAKVTYFLAKHMANIFFGETYG